MKAAIAEWTIAVEGDALEKLSIDANPYSKFQAARLVPRYQDDQQKIK